MHLDVSTLHSPSPRKWAVLPSRAKGFDSEASGAGSGNGEAFLLSDSTGRHVWTHGAQESLDFLASREYRATCNFAWNLSADAAFLLGRLPEAVLDDLAHRKPISVHGHSVRLTDHLLVVDGVKYWDASVFYSRKLGMGDHARALLGDSKLPMTFPLREADRGRADVLAYCVKDARLTQRLGQLVLDDLALMGVRPASLTSCGAILKGMVSAVAPDPTAIPPEAQEYAAASYHGGWSEVFRRGHFPRLFNYDLRSAYPAVMDTLPDVTAGQWTYRKGKPPSGVGIGFARCRVGVRQDAPFSPLQYATRRFPDTTVLRSPWGEWDTTLSLDEIRFALSLRGVAVTVTDGWYFHAKWTGRYPFQRAMRSLYDARAKVRNPYVVKTVANALSGALIENHNGKAGALCNPVYAALTTARTRVRVASIVAPCVQHLVSIMTDGFALTEPLPVSMLGNGMGDVKLDAEGEAVVVGENFWTLHGTPDTRIAPLRWKGKDGRTVDAFELFGEHPNAEEFRVQQRFPVTVGMGVQSNETEKIGRFVNVRVPYPLNGLTRRGFPVVTAGDLLAGEYQSTAPSVADCEAEFSEHNRRVILDADD